MGKLLVCVREFELLVRREPDVKRGEKRIRFILWKESGAECGE